MDDRKDELLKAALELLQDLETCDIGVYYNIRIMRLADKLDGHLRGEEED